MKRANRFLTAHERERVEQAVAEAETKTSAEIVPALATASGRYDRAEDIAGLWLGLIAMAIAWWIMQGLSTDDAQWGPAIGRYELPILLAATVLGYVLGVVIATYSFTVRGLFTPAKQMREEVQEAAHHLFSDKRVHHTAGATGVLVYVSLFERMAVVLGDQAVVDQVGEPVIEALCTELIEGIKKGDAATAFCDVITEAGERLGAVLPRTEADRNELANALIIVD